MEIIDADDFDDSSAAVFVERAVQRGVATAPQRGDGV